MDQQSFTQGATEAVPELADEDNEALLDASKTFLITVIGAALFCLSALFVVLRTRIG